MRQHCVVVPILIFCCRDRRLVLAKLVLVAPLKSLFHSFEKLLGELPDPSDLLLLVLAKLVLGAPL